MTTEVVNTEVEQTSPQETQPDIYETKAAEMGWRPKSEWDGAEEDFIDAKEFVRRQPLFEKIEGQSKSIKQLQQAFEALKTHHSRVKETEYQRALLSLKDARKDALREGDTDRALAYEEKIEDIEKQKADFEADVSTVNVKTQDEHPDFVSWKRLNPWYSKDEELRAFADTYGVTLSKQGKSPAEVLKLVSERVKKGFPDKFVNPNREKPGSVEAPSRKGASADTFALTEEERGIMKKLVRSGVFGDDVAKAEAAYIKELKRVKGQ